MGLEGYAKRFASAGFITLVFDYRHFGESEGQPRGQLFPREQLDDYCNAISWLSHHQLVDPERIGVWGTSQSGGNVLHLAAFDRRVKAVVAQVPNTWSPEQRLIRNPAGLGLRTRLVKDRTESYESRALKYMKVVAPRGEVCALPGVDTYEFYIRAKDSAPNWRNEITMESNEKLIEFDPVGPIRLIAPTPLLMVVAEKDTLIPSDMSRAAFERAGEPKKLCVLPCSHFDVYDEPWFSKILDLEVDWFRQHLLKK
jgi:fermentation-respiration switch protein FrsA (DUF1100 family)